MIDIQGYQSKSDLTTAGGGRGSLVGTLIEKDFIPGIKAGVKKGEFVSINSVLAQACKDKDYKLIGTGKQTGNNSHWSHYVRKNSDGTESRFAYTTFWHAMKKALLASGFKVAQKGIYERTS